MNTSENTHGKSCDRPDNQAPEVAEPGQKEIFAIMNGEVIPDSEIVQLGTHGKSMDRLDDKIPVIRQPQIKKILDILIGKAGPQNPGPQDRF